MASGQLFWRSVAVASVAAVVYLGYALSTRDGGTIEPSAHAQTYSRMSQNPDGSDAAIMVAADLVKAKYDAMGQKWDAKDAVDKAAEEVGQTASLIVRNYRPYAVPRPQEEGRGGVPTVKEGEAKQPGK